MPTVLDALVMTIGLDPAGFVKGQNEVVSSFGKTKDAATKAGREVEKTGKDMAESLSKATGGVLTLMAAFLGGRGIKEFIGDASKANTALGNLGASLGVSPQWASAWGMAAERMGGSAASTQASIRTLSDSLNDLRTSGKALPDAMFQLEAKSGKSIDFLHGVVKYTTDLATAAQALAKTDPATADRLLRSMGIDEGTAQLMIRQGPAMDAYLKSMRGLTPTAKDIAASAGMTDHLARLNQSFGNLATKLGTAVSPGVDALADSIAKLVDKMADFAEKNPGWTEAIIGILSLLSAGKILLAISNVLSLGAAVRGLVAADAAASGGGLLALLARLNPYVAGALAAGAVMNPGDLNAGEDERARQERYGQHGGGGGGGGQPAGGGDTPSTPVGPPGAPGTYRPKYNLSAADLSDSVIAKINGEATSTQQSTDAVINNMFNRLGTTTYGPSGNLTQVAFAPGQYAGYRRASAKRAEEIRARIRAIADGSVPDNTFGSNEYRASYYHGPWYQHHAGAPVVGGNRFAYNPKGGRGPYAPYSHPNPQKQSSLWNGGLGGNPMLGRGGAAHVASLNNISNDNRATTTSSSNEMHVGTVNVNAPQATDAHGIAKHINVALANNMFASYANYGPA